TGAPCLSGAVSDRGALPLRGRASLPTGVPRLRGSGGAAEHAYEPCFERAGLTDTDGPPDEPGPGCVVGNGVRGRAQRQAAAPQPGGPTGPTPRTTPGTRHRTSAHGRADQTRRPNPGAPIRRAGRSRACRAGAALARDMAASRSRSGAVGVTPTG